MSFWKNLADSYDKNAATLKAKYPLSTTTISNKSEMIAVISISGNGEFISAGKIEKVKINKKTGEAIVPYQEICIPVSEKSMGRSSGIAPHPVFDQYGYLQGNGEKFEVFLSQLEKFANSSFATVNVKAIYKYMTKRSIEGDLAEMKPKDKTNVAFRVEIKGSPQANVWEDAALFDAWHRYYLDSKKDEKELDYLSGDQKPKALLHPKKISTEPTLANAKLISDNDTSNYTFRGKFSKSEEAVSIGYETSQKAHQFLRYLIKDRGILCGEQVIVSFEVASTEKILLPPLEDRSIADILRANIQVQPEVDQEIALRADTGFDYAEAMRKALAGFGYGKALTQHAKTAVVALDAATPGRLSITFYRELDKREYLEKIADWHNSCRWNQQFWDGETSRYISYLGAPSVDRIIEAVYGKPRGGTDASYGKIKKAARERLLRCIFDGAFLPSDYLSAAIHRSSNPLGIVKDGKFDRNGFERILSTTCAMICRKLNENKQQHTEDYTLSLEPERNDRDYLYGRLLGAADELEEYALRRNENDRMVTAAIRYMQTFEQRPFRTWQTIHACLNPYIQVVKGSFAFNEIQSVMQLFTAGDYERDAPLNGAYLIGYYHERAYINQLAKNAAEAKANKNNNQENDNDDQ